MQGAEGVACHDVCYHSYWYFKAIDIIARAQRTGGVMTLLRAGGIDPEDIRLHWPMEILDLFAGNPKNANRSRGKTNARQTGDPSVGH